MPDINAPVAPDVLSPEPHNPPAGNWQDDDGVVIDGTFEPPAHEPLDYDALIREDIDPDLPQPTRMIVRSVTMTGGDDPVQLLPPDVNRLQCQLKFTATNAACQLHIGSEKTDCYGGYGLTVEYSTAGVLRSTWLTLDAHTGALWVYPEPSVGVFVHNILVVAVTR